MEALQGCPVPQKAKAWLPGTLWAKVRKLGFHPRAPVCHGGLCAGLSVPQLPIWGTVGSTFVFLGLIGKLCKLQGLGRHIPVS